MKPVTNAVLQYFTKQQSLPNIVMSGEAIIENVTLSEGDYLYTPVNFRFTHLDQTSLNYQ
jgi:hypothetical protein